MTSLWNWHQSLLKIRSKTLKVENDTYFMTAEIKLYQKGVTRYFMNDLLLKTVELVDNRIFDWIMTD